MPLLTLLLPFLQSILPDVIKRVLPPEKMSQEEQTKVQQEVMMALMQQDWKSIEAQYADVANARNLAATDISHGNALSTFMSSIVRPIWGLGGFVLVAYSWWTHSAIDPAFQAIITTVLEFYFGGKIVEAITPHVTEMVATFGRNKS